MIKINIVNCFSFPRYASTGCFATVFAVTHPRYAGSLSVTLRSSLANERASRFLNLLLICTFYLYIYLFNFNMLFLL